MIAITTLALALTGLYGSLSGAIYDHADAPNIKRRKEEHQKRTEAFENAEYTLTYRLKKVYGSTSYEYCYYLFRYLKEVHCDVYLRKRYPSGEVTEEFCKSLRNEYINLSMDNRKNNGFWDIPLDDPS